MEKNLDDECPICLEINGHNECIEFDCCNKYIHKDCIDEWLLKNMENYNTYNKLKCLYCHKKNTYIDQFIDNNKNDHIINFNQENINSNQRRYVNRYFSYRFCIVILITIFLFFSIITIITVIVSIWLPLD